MHFLQRAWQLADARGYMRYPQVVALQDRIPEWFRSLATPPGLAAFEQRRGIFVPPALREFYACVPLACFVEAAIDGEIFLTQMLEEDPDLPPTVVWRSVPHLVFAFHCHSGSVCAAELGVDDPLMFWGFEDDAQPVMDEKHPPVCFSEWVFGVVDGYEALLDFWQGAYLKWADPAESLRLGGLEWVRDMPGMAERLGLS